MYATTIHVRGKSGDVKAKLALVDIYVISRVLFTLWSCCELHSQTNPSHPALVHHPFLPLKLLHIWNNFKRDAQQQDEY